MGLGGPLAEGGGPPELEQLFYVKSVSRPVRASFVHGFFQLDEASIRMLHLQRAVLVLGGLML